MDPSSGVMVIALIESSPGLDKALITLDENKLQLDVNISLTLDLTAAQARRKLTRFFMDEVSLFINPQDPLLVVVDQETILWRFSIIFSMGRRGKLGQLGEVDVDARSGELLLDDKLLEEIKTNARSLARGTAFSTNG